IMSLVEFHQDQWGPTFVGEGFPEWGTLTDGLPIRPLPDFPLPYFQTPALQHAYDNLWSNQAGPSGVGIQDRFAAAWAHAAGRAAATTGVRGGKLPNEPSQGPNWKECTEAPFCPGQNQVLTDFSRRSLAAIRTTDQDHMVWYEPWVTFDLG